MGQNGLFTRPSALSPLKHKDEPSLYWPSWFPLDAGSFKIEQIAPKSNTFFDYYERRIFNPAAYPPCGFDPLHPSLKSYK